MQANVQIYKLLILELQFRQIHRGFCRLSIKTRTSHKHRGSHGCFQQPNSDFTPFPVTWNVPTAIICLALNWWKNLCETCPSCMTQQIPWVQASSGTPPDHPSVVYQPRLRSLTTIQKVNDQCWWSQNIKMRVSNLDPTRIINEWLP